MRALHRGQATLVALLLITACTSSPAGSAGPSGVQSPSATPAPDVVVLLAELLSDPEMGFQATFSGEMTVSAPQDPSAHPVPSDMSGTFDAAGSDFRSTASSTDLASAANQVWVAGRNYLSQGGGPWIEDTSAVRFPTVREELFDILEAEEGYTAGDDLVIRVTPADDACGLLLVALLLVDKTMNPTEAPTCQLELTVDSAGVLKQMALEAEAPAELTGVAILFSWTLVYAFSEFGPRAEIAAPADPWATYAWDAASIQIGHPVAWEIAGTDLNPVLYEVGEERVVTLIGGLVDGGPMTAEQLTAQTELLMSQNYGMSVESREAVEIGTLSGTLLRSHGTFEDGLAHSYLAATTVHPSGRVYIIEFIGLPGGEAEDEAFFRMMLKTILFDS